MKFFGNSYGTESANGQLQSPWSIRGPPAQRTRPMRGRLRHRPPVSTRITGIGTMQAAVSVKHCSTSPMESGSGGFSPGAALRAATRGCPRTRLGHSWRKSSRVFPGPAGKCRFPFPYWLASRVPEARHCQSEVADLSYFAEDRGLGLPELTPLGKCSGAVALEIIP